MIALLAFVAASAINADAFATPEKYRAAVVVLGLRALRASAQDELWEQARPYDSGDSLDGIVANPDFSLTADFRLEMKITPGDAASSGTIAGRGRSGVPRGWLLLITPSRHVILYLYGATGYEHAAGLTPSCVKDVVDFGGLWGGELTSRTALPVGEETTLVLLRAGDTFELYVDGDLSCAADVTSWSDTATHVPHAVGAYYAPGTGGPTELPFDGKITATKVTEVSANDGTAPTPAPTAPLDAEDLASYEGEIVRLETGSNCVEVKVGHYVGYSPGDCDGQANTVDYGTYDASSANKKKVQHYTGGALCTTCEHLESCFGYWCDYWTGLEGSSHTCNSLDWQFGCDCDGCSCTKPPKDATESTLELVPTSQLAAGARELSFAQVDGCTWSFELRVGT